MDLKNKSFTGSTTFISAIIRELPLYFRCETEFRENQLGLNANRSQSSLFHEIKTMLENTQLLFLGESAIHLSNIQNIY